MDLLKELTQMVLLLLCYTQPEYLRKADRAIFMLDMNIQEIITKQSDMDSVLKAMKPILMISYKEGKRKQLENDRSFPITKFVKTAPQKNFSKVLAIF